MNAIDFVLKHNIEISKIHGNIGDYDGRILIETKSGEWEFWNENGTVTRHTAQELML